MSSSTSAALVFFAVVAAYLASPPGWPWFAYHPFAMLFAFFPVAGNAILYKQAKGYQNTKMHGYLMTTSFALALFGWYVIYSNKTASGKTHNTSWHAWVGLACLGMYFLLLLNGLLALHPDFGQFKSSQVIRAVHSYGGRTATALGFLATGMGWYTIKGLESTLMLSVPITGLAWLLLK